MRGSFSAKLCFLAQRICFPPLSSPSYSLNKARSRRFPPSSIPSTALNIVPQTIYSSCREFSRAVLKSCTTSVQNSCVLHTFWGEKNPKSGVNRDPFAMESPCSGRGFGCGKAKLNACLCSFWDSPEAQHLGGGLQAMALLLRRLRHRFSRETSSHPRQPHRSRRRFVAASSVPASL